ncbi:putative disease resistance protein At3g14460 [Phragmites australis]|uniref:putative disease resistance protein At3g14460 n=1 Tax=Phragmites australis TaxID=29695 RepID=UPI002D76757B|nr:putative disease resistance protein At3g14460 [Phragmites australis]
MEKRVWVTTRSTVRTPNDLTECKVMRGIIDQELRERKYKHGDDDKNGVAPNQSALGWCHLETQLVPAFVIDEGILLDYMAIVSTTTAVGWVVSPIINSMVSLVQSYISSQYSWKSEVENDLKNLTVTLVEILPVVGVAERRKVVDRDQMVLLRQMKEAVCDAEDVLDEFDYMLLRGKNEHQGMVRRIASSSLSLGKRLIGVDKLRSKLQKVIESMTRVKDCAVKFVSVMGLEITDSSQSHECVPARATGSFPNEDTILGREKEFDELVSWLLKQSDVPSPDNGLSLITEVHHVAGVGGTDKAAVAKLIYNDNRIALHTIVGGGGIGKTTVAQRIYNDKRITETFDLKMWVCVSYNFDKINLLKEIIAHTTGGKNIELTNFNFNMLQEELKRRISGKRFLLVLDDVWYDENFGEHNNKQRWSELMAPMENAQEGSKILVTTRMELVAKMLDSRNPFFLQGLGQDKSWSLFSKCADMSDDIHPELRRIGSQIVQGLHGLPLAIKVIGGHLKSKSRVAEWNEVLQNNTFDQNDISKISRLSYDGLPEHLKRCFAYCSLFPKGYHIDPNRLIHMWIAQGFVDIGGSAKTSLEDRGRSYFNDLLTRSFFQMLRHGNQTFYVMHDIMCDLALNVSEGECFRFGREDMEEIPLYTRHLSVYSENLGNLVNCDLTKLRSLIVLSKSWFCSKVCLNHDILRKLKSVRVLDISGCCFEKLPDAVNRLIHLRYLGISRTYYPLPQEMTMYHLQALFVQYHSCCSLREYGNPLKGRVKNVAGHFHLPESINKLINLTHVHVEKAYVLMLSSTHILPSVECAGEFHVDEEEGSLVGLKDLKKLRGQLTIMSLDKVKNKVEASKAHLHLKEHITKLELQWGSSKCASSTKRGFEVLDALKPHPDLEELTISGYPGARSPSWLESCWLSRVQLICLRDCGRLEVLPPLGNLPLLKTLEVRRMEKLKTLGREFFGYAGFPSLESLLLELLPKLEWCLVDNDQVFHNLRHLSVAGCPELRAYPTYPRTLEHIAILDKERIQVKAYMDSVVLSRSFCCLVSSFFHVLHAHHLEFVENMEIFVNCVVPESMSKTVFGNLKSLKKLKIYGIDLANTLSVVATLWDENGCTMLPSSLGRLELQRCYLQPSSLSKFSSLDTLHLIECDTLEMPCLPLSLRQLRMLKQLEIHGCDWITSFEGAEALVSLEEMKIDQCNDLEYVPAVSDMPSLQKLHLSRCPQVMRLSMAGHQTALKELVIAFCDALSSLGELRGLVSLTKLEVVECSDFVLLPEMDSLYSLRILVINRCPRLRSLPRSGFPVSLKAFFLNGCHPALGEQFQRKEGPDWNKVAALPGYMCCTDISSEQWHLQWKWNSDVSESANGVSFAQDTDLYYSE